MQSFRVKLIFLLLSAFSISTINAQFSYFGRNKVQYTNFNWHVLKTDNFDIYYYPEIQEIAEVGAKFAEEAFLDLQEKFNHIVLQRIPLIFYNTHLHFQQTNTYPGFLPEGVGGFFEFMKGRVVIPADGSLAQFNHVIRHELVHVFMTSKVIRIQKDHRLAFEINIPLWFSEGLAEYWSADWDSQAEMILRDAVINEYVVGLTRMDEIYGSFLMYKEGQKILSYISKVYGEDKILKLIENSWKSKDFSEVIKFTIEKNYEDFDTEWLYSLKKEYFPILSQLDPPSIISKKITKYGFNFSPNYYEAENHQWIYFFANRDGYASIYRMRIDTNENESTIELVLRGEKSDEFESFHLFKSSFSINKKGLIAFSSKRGETDVLHIFDTGKKEIIETIQNQDLISISNPSWSNDGERIVFSSIDKKGFSDIFIYDTRKRKIERLTNDYYDDRQPVFSPNDNFIVFSSDRTCGNEPGRYNLFEISLNNLDIKYVTYSKYNSTNPRFSSNGTKLIFTNDFDGVSNIWSIDVTNYIDGYSYSNRMKRITKFTTSSFDPNITPNNSVVFCALEKLSFQIYEFKDYSEISDSLNEIVHFDLDLYQNIWKAERIYAERIKSNLRYKGDYTLDFAQSQIATNPVYGTTGGGILSVSDVLSDDQYLFFIYNNAQSSSDFLKSFNVAVSRLFLGKKTNYSFGIFHFSGRRYDIRDSDEYFFERSYGGFLGLSYPLSNFQRFEASIGLANSDKEIFGIKNRKAVLLTNSISYIYDNSIWISTGPLDGHRFLFLLGQTNDIKFSNVNYFTIMFDYRYYLRIDLRTTLALRAQLFYNHGSEARRYFMGGNWDLRGWDRWSIRGEKLWLSSVELRFPLVNQILISFPFMKLNFYDLRSAVFADFGSAWDSKYETTLGSVGFGFRINLFGVVVLRYDIGKKLENNLKKIQKGLFYQFFFGWDF